MTRCCTTKLTDIRVHYFIWIRRNRPWGLTARSYSQVSIKDFVRRYFRIRGITRSD
uniref:Uncharacterized protein n=1 Tax=Amphimedon queenslandica TaxID=400682 RepID=A0A1X7UJ99_AMPQE